LKLHANAALGWSGRRLLCERVLVDRWTLTPAASAAAASVRCARKWVSRYRVEGERLPDRSSAHRPRRRDATASGRGTIGWENVHTSPVDDHSRLAYAEALPDERASTAIAFLRRAIAFFANYAIRVERVLTDNGSADISTIHAAACRALATRHLPHPTATPPNQRQAERFIRTRLAGWANGAIYRSSSERTAAPGGWLWHHDHRRRHAALGHRPPVNRTNPPGSYS
jgi:hypothetical protein